MSAAVEAAGVRVKGEARRAVWLVATVVLLSTAIQALLALRMRSPWIIPDELIYSELAKSLAAGQLPAIRGTTTFGYGIVYPLLIAPAWLLSKATSAYEAARVLNAFLISLAAIPAYLLAGHFVSRRLALVVATLAVFVPSSVYASTILVENAFYPAFLLAVLLIVRALDRPSVARQIAAIAAVGLAFEVKALAGVLVPAYVCAIVLHGRADRAPGGLRRFRLTLGLLVGGVALALVAATAATGNPARVVGAYAVVLRHVDPSQIPWWFLLHVAEIDLYVLFAPFAATLLVVCLVATGRIVDPKARLFAVVVVPVVTWTIAVAAAFASWPSAGAPGVPATPARVYERSTFELAPLLLLGLAVWIELGMPRPRFWAIGVASVTAILPAVLPLSRLRFNANFQALALVPALTLDAVAIWWPVIALAAGSLLALSFLHVKRERTGTLWLVVGTWFLVVATFAYGSLLASSKDTRGVAVGSSLTWIDDAVGTRADVSVLWREAGTGVAHPATRQRVVWVNEFFNRSVGTVYELGGQMPYGLPSTRVSLRAGVVVDPSGRPVRSPFVLASCRLGVVGTVVASDRRTGVAVYRTGRVVRVSEQPSARCSRATR